MPPRDRRLLHAPLFSIRVRQEVMRPKWFGAIFSARS
jgi:hypothetical protein